MKIQLSLAFSFKIGHWQNWNTCVRDLSQMTVTVQMRRGGSSIGLPDKIQDAQLNLNFR